MSALIKFPEEDRLYGADFSEQPEIVAGETLTGTPTITATLLSGTGTLTVESPTIVGAVVKARFTGGTLGAVFQLLFRVTTSTGRILAAVGILKITRE